MGLKRRACVAGVLLCGGGVVALGVPAAALASGTVTVTFSTPGPAQFTVPPGVTSVTFDVAGAQGGANPGNLGASGGLGADVQGTVAFAAPETLSLTVGGQGGSSAAGAGAGGIGGGASGGAAQFAAGAGGGGASSVTGRSGTLITAAGGGGASGGFNVPGGNSGSPGGGDTANLDGGPGGPGGQTAGGSGGTGGSGTCSEGVVTDGVTGADGEAGTGGAGGAQPDGQPAGGGGGGGFFGGGGGGGAADCPTQGATGGAGGGGGGSSHIDPSVTGSTLTDGANSGDGSITITFDDNVPPAASPVAQPAANANGWNNTDVTVDWNWTDPLSTIDPNNCTTQSSSSGEGTMTLTANCTDEAGNVGTASFTVKVDKTPPTVAVQTPADGATYAIGQSVAAAYSCTDNQGGSGVESCTGPVDPGEAIETATPGLQTFTVDAGDLAGNTATATATYTVAGVPRVALGSPFGGAQYTQGQTVTASYLCAEGVDGPGISSCTGTVPNGQQIDTSTVGVHEFTVTATSIDGLHSTSTATYTVVASPGGGGSGGSGGAGGSGAPPDNHFAVSHVRVKRNGNTSFQIKVPGPGSVAVLETAWHDKLAATAVALESARRQFIYARAHHAATKAGTVRITLKPNARDGRLLRRHRRHKYKLTLRLSVTYTPTSGTSRTRGLKGLHLPKTR